MISQEAKRILQMCTNELIRTLRFGFGALIFIAMSMTGLASGINVFDGGFETKWIYGNAEDSIPDVRSDGGDFVERSYTVGVEGKGTLYYDYKFESNNVEHRMTLTVNGEIVCDGVWTESATGCSVRFDTPGHHDVVFVASGFAREGIPGCYQIWRVSELTFLPDPLETIDYVADDGVNEYCGAGIGISVTVSTPATGATVKYAESADGPWLDAVAYTDVCTDRPIYFQISAAGYDTVVDSRNVTVTPKSIEGLVWPVLPSEDYVYDGTAKTPDAAFGDGDPSILTANDFDVAYADNVNAGTAQMIFTGKNNYTGTDVQMFEILKRRLTLTSGDGSWTHDGTAHSETTVTVGGDGFAPSEGATYGNFATLADADSVPNSFDYTLDAGTLAGNYEITKVYGTLTVTKAVIGGGREEPGSDDVPDGGLSKFDAAHEYDGNGHTIDTAAIRAAFDSAMVGAGETRVGFGYAADGTVATEREQVADWREVAPVYTNAGEYDVWYRVTNQNYEDFVHAAKVTITRRDIANATIAPIPDVTFADSPVTPVPVVTDQMPSIVTASDYDVSYRDNDRPGTATLTLMGKGNYRGTKSATFIIKPAPASYAALTGTLAWKLNMGTGCYTAQLKLTCTNGFSQGISDLRFVYQDRRDGTKITAGLWNSSARAYRPTVSVGGTTYRFVDLDATKLTSQDVTALYGVADVSQTVGTVPSAQCAIELFVSDLSSPVSDIGYVMWKSNGAQCSLPISAAGGSQGLAVSETMLGVVRLASSASPLDAPLSTAALNASLALGVVIDPASSPYCRLTAFAVTATGLSGRVEVGKARGGRETRGALGANAQVVLMGAKSLSEGFVEIGRVSVEESGAFLFPLGNNDCQFFRVEIVVESVIE